MQQQQQQQQQQSDPTIKENELAKNHLLNFSQPVSRNSIKSSDPNLRMFFFDYWLFLIVQLIVGFILLVRGATMISDTSQTNTQQSLVFIISGSYNLISTIALSILLFQVIAKRKLQIQQTLFRSQKEYIITGLLIGQIILIYESFIFDNQLDNFWVPALLFQLVNMITSNLSKTGLAICENIIIILYFIVRYYSVHNDSDQISWVNIVFSILYSCLAIGHHVSQINMRQIQRKKLRAERQQINALKSFYHDILSLMPIGIAIINRNRELIYASNKVLEILKCPASEVGQVLMSLSTESNQPQKKMEKRKSRYLLHQQLVQQQSNKSNKKLKSQVDIPINKDPEDGPHNILQSIQQKNTLPFVPEQKANMNKEGTDVIAGAQVSSIVNNNLNNKNVYKDQKNDINLQDKEKKVSENQKKFNKNIINNNQFIDDVNSNIESLNNIAQMGGLKLQHQSSQNKMNLSGRQFDRNLSYKNKDALFGNLSNSHSNYQDSQHTIQDNINQITIKQSSIRKTNAKNMSLLKTMIQKKNTYVDKILINMFDQLNNSSNLGPENEVQDVVLPAQQQPEPQTDGKNKLKPKLEGSFLNEVVQNVVQTPSPQHNQKQPLKGGHHLPSNNNKQKPENEGEEPPSQKSSFYSSSENGSKRSLVEQMDANNNIGYYQFKDNMVQMQVQWQEQNLILKFLMCEFEKSYKSKQPVVLVLIDPVWQEFIKQKLEDMAQYKMRMFASLSHELRTPLNCSISMMEVLEKEIHQKELIDMYLLPALHSNKLLLNQINDILDFVQMDSGKFKMTQVDFDLVKLLRDCMIMISMQARIKGLTLEQKCDPRIPNIIRTDPNRVRQVILNFLSNALKFTVEGKITLSAMAVKDDVIEIGVTDTGIGISPDNVKKIFTAFNKVDLGENQTLNSQGCGLGLTLSNSLAKCLGPDDDSNHGIMVKSTQKIGSTFSFFLKDNYNEKTLYKNYESCNILPNERESNHQKVIERQAFQIPQIKFQENSSIIDAQQVSSEQENNKEDSSDHAGGVVASPAGANQLSLNSLDLNSSHKSFHSVKTNKTRCEGYCSYMPTMKAIENFTIDDLKEKLKKIKCQCSQVLICDDNEFNVYALSTVLSGYGIKVVTALGGRQAIDKVEKQLRSTSCCKNLKLIFMDIEMPMMNGYDAAQAIHNLFLLDEVYECPPIIACTAYVGQEDKDLARKYGMKDFITKPIIKKGLEQLLIKYFMEEFFD